MVALTHCNTGSLASAGFGTALGAVRALHEMGRLRTAYCTETRPYNQAGHTHYAHRMRDLQGDHGGLRKAFVEMFVICSSAVVL